MQEDELGIQLASGVAAFEAKEFRRAMQLLSPLAEAGVSAAQFRVAIMCQNGLDGVPNPDAALRWMTAAAEQGEPLAQHGLGFMYAYGECVEHDVWKSNDISHIGPIDEARSKIEQTKKHVLS